MFNEVSKIKGCQFANIKYVSDVKLLGGKKNALQGRVQKLVVSDIQINYDYETAVNNRLEKEGKERNFSAQSLPWGSWLVPNKVIEHKGEKYLRFYCKKNATPKVTYLVDGRKATDAEIADIKATMPTIKNYSGTQGAVGLDENQVEPKNVKFSNIIELHVDGKIILGENNNVKVGA